MQTLTVYTSSATVSIGAATVPTYLPASFASATRTHTREVTAGEFAQLPDFSFGLWDWAQGHETCPINDGSDATLCHDFASHMGPVNSNHFVPQAATSYASYHRLAVARAAQCHAMSTALVGSDGRFDDTVKACEREALSLEAIGQHFLQDAWSMGHMWERWGSTSLDDFPGATVVEKRDRAVLVALVSGFIHGARGVLQALPQWTTYDVNDAMCAPRPAVRFVTDDGVLSRGVGDDYGALLFPPLVSTQFGEQQQRFLDCATSGLLEVYEATGLSHGPVGTSQPGLTRLDPTSARCFAQRATNEAMVQGMAIDLKTVGVQTTIPLDARFTSWLVPKVARVGGQTPVDRKLRNEFRFSLQRVVTMAKLKAKESPTGIELASGGLGDFLGAKPNGQYLQASPFEEPTLPWPGLADAASTGRAAALARVFHQAHAADWCENDDLTAIKAHARDKSLDIDGKITACAACVEMAQRHLRVGAPAQYDVSREPLCSFVSANPSPSAYQAGASTATTKALATTWCGCQ